MSQHKPFPLALLLGASLLAATGQAQPRPTAANDGWDNPPPAALQAPIGATETTQRASYLETSWNETGPIQQTSFQSPADDKPSATVAVSNTGPSQSALVVSVTGPETVPQGQPAVYQIVVSNAGTVPLLEVRLEQPVVPEARAVADPAAGQEQNRLVWRLGTLAPQSERRIRLELTSSAVRELTIQPTATFTSPALARTKVLARPLALVQTGPETVERGSRLVMQIQVVNNTARPMHKVSLLAQLPRGLRHPQGERIEAEPFTLAAGEARSLPLEVEALQAGRLVTQFSAWSQEGHLIRSLWAVQSNEPAPRQQVQRRADR